MIKSLAVGTCRDHPGGEESLDFGSKEQPVALPAPIQGRDPKAIASEVQLAFLRIPQRDRELSAQMLPSRFAVIFPEMRNDFRVAVRDEAMAFRREFFASLDVIEQLAVEDHEEIALFVRHRLLAIGQSDNAQPARGERDTGPLEKSLLVRTAMEDRARHLLHHTGWRRALPGQIDDPCDAAHSPTIAEDGVEKSQEMMRQE